jgi:predicted small secreted protein
MRNIARMRQCAVGVLLAVLVLAGTATLLGGCNTTAGVGQDVSATGRAVTNSAEKVKQGL